VERDLFNGPITPGHQGKVYATTMVSVVAVDSSGPAPAVERTDIRHPPPCPVHEMYECFPVHCPGSIGGARGMPLYAQVYQYISAQIFFIRPNCPSPWNDGHSQRDRHTTEPFARSYRSQPPATDTGGRTLGDWSWRLGTGHRRRARGDRRRWRPPHRRACESS
jgi:hypothetical protein